MYQKIPNKNADFPIHQLISRRHISYFWGVGKSQNTKKLHQNTTFAISEQSY